MHSADYLVPLMYVIKGKREGGGLRERENKREERVREQKRGERKQGVRKRDRQMERGEK